MDTAHRSPGRRRRGLSAGLLAVLLALLLAVLLGSAALPGATAVAPADREKVPWDAAVARDHGYVWPTGGPVPVVRGFDPPAVVWGPGHRGADLAHGAGSPVRAAADGVVVFAGVVVDRPVVSIEHADGIRTTYEPVRPIVSAGQRVSAGEAIGRLLGGHCGPGAPDCLHLGARSGPDQYVDPLSLLGEEVVIRLFPT